MTDIHKTLEKATFQKPSGIVEQTVCKTTGCLATTGCTDTYKEIFASNNLPEKCPGHGSQRLCTVSGKIANEYCPSTRVNYFGAVLPKEQLNLWKAVNGKNATSGTRVEEVCDIHKKPEEKPKEEEKPKNNTNTNTEKQIQKIKLIQIQTQTQQNQKQAQEETAQKKNQMQEILNR